MGAAGPTTALSGLTSGAFWLVFASLLLGEGVLQTGLGKRLALLSLRLLGTRYESALAGPLFRGWRPLLSFTRLPTPQGIRLIPRKPRERREVGQSIRA